MLNIIFATNQTVGTSQEGIRKREKETVKMFTELSLFCFLTVPRTLTFNRQVGGGVQTIIKNEISKKPIPVRFLKIQYLKIHTASTKCLCFTLSPPSQYPGFLYHLLEKHYRHLMRPWHPLMCLWWGWNWQTATTTSHLLIGAADRLSLTLH